MHHRGPDEQGTATCNEATLGGCRLAIFDPAHGHQPMISPDGRWTLVFNGAIYNFKSLRDELAASSWSFRTACDTEVLLAAFARWGVACLGRLRGMFAFAVWDDFEKALYAARDPFGIKPLYYTQSGGELVFASEINALIASGTVDARVDPQAVADYLAWFAVPAPATIYRGIKTLRPGEYLTYRNDRTAIERAWDFQRIPEARCARNSGDFTRELRARLEDSIKAHMLADVPVGAFLSGGLDSAAIVALMSSAGGARLRTFTLVCDEPGYSEALSAEATARHFGTDHHTRILTGVQVAGDLEQILSTFDQPTGDGVNAYYASQSARAGGVKVALSGLGGDELFGGYPSFVDTPRLAGALPWWLRLPAALRHVIVHRLQRGDTRRRKLADILRHATNLHEVAALQRRVFSESTRSRLLHTDVREATASLPPFHPELECLKHELGRAGVLETVRAWELRTYMADVLLRDSDVMSMRHSLELRVPFIDRPLVEWLWHQSPAIAFGRRKSALYEAVADLVPAGLRTRKKQGFALPFAVWMKRDLRPFLEETFSTTNICRSGLFEPKAVRELWEGFLKRDDNREWSRVWSLAMLAAFVNRRAPLSAAPSQEPVAPVAPSAPPHPHRTLLMAPELYGAEGGIPRILQIYLKALCESDVPGNRVRVLALNDAPGDGTVAWSRLQGAVERASACSRSKTRFVRRGLELARGCDLLICGHVRQLPVAWLARRLNPSLRYYLVAHGIEVWRRFNAAERAALRGAERIFCVSDYTRRELLRNCPLPEGRAVVLPNALDPIFAVAGGRPLADCPPTILMVTRVTAADRYKGVQHMIEAMPAIRAAIPGAKLRIVGRGDDVERLRKMRDRLGLTRAVEFVGYVEDAHLPAELGSCRLFALPSRKEGFGLVLLEAMAHGRPCLGARAGGIPEVITPATGVLVEYGDVPGIAAAAIDALGRRWSEPAILARAREFSFASFKQRLSDLLAA